MTVGIDEARCHRHLPGIDDLCLPAREVLDIAATADRNELTVFDRESLGPGLGIVDRVNTRVHDQQLRPARPSGFSRTAASNSGACQHATQADEFGTRHLRHYRPPRYYRMCL